MNEIQLLWLVLLVLYLGDSLWWAGWNACVLERWWPGGPWRLRRSNEWPTNQTSALIPLWPLPLAVSHQLDPLPVSLSPAGFATWTADAWTSKGRPQQLGIARRWSEIDEVTTKGNAVLIDGEEVLTTALQHSATDLAKTLEGLRAAATEDREGLILDWWTAATDLESAADRIRTAVAEGRILRGGGAALWFTMLVMAPLVLTQFSSPRVLTTLALALVSLVLFNVWHFVRSHARALPLERWQRIETALIMCFNWPMAARAAEMLGRYRLAGVHPLAAALALQPMAGGQTFVEHVLRDAQHPLEHGQLDATTQEIVEWHLQWQQQRLEELADRAGFTTTEKPPEHRSFCPRCLSAFTRDQGACPDCPGVELAKIGDSEERDNQGGSYG